MEPRIINESDYAQTIMVGENGVMDHESDIESHRRLSARLRLDDRIMNLLIPDDCIRKRIRSMAKDIGHDYAGSRKLDAIVVLTGAMFFASDLSRELYTFLSAGLEIHLIKTSVYDRTIKSSSEEYRTVRLDLEPKDMKNSDVLLIEDIVDQGFTLTWLVNYLVNERKVGSLKICSLINKELKNPSSRVKEMRNGIKVSYTGFNVKDIWVAGYGIDASQELRNLPFIVSINEKTFR